VSFFLGKVLFSVLWPFRIFSWVFVNMASLFDGSVKYDPKYDKNTMIFGYIDGLAKLISIGSSKILTSILEDRMKVRHMAYIATLLVMTFTFVMGKTNSLMKSYMVFILGSICSTLSLLWSYDGFTTPETKPIMHVIYGTNLVVSSLIHICISYYSKYKNYNVNVKMYMYFWTNLVLLGMASSIGLMSTNINK